MTITWLGHEWEVEDRREQPLSSGPAFILRNGGNRVKVYEIDRTCETIVALVDGDDFAEEVVVIPYRKETA